MLGRLVRERLEAPGQVTAVDALFEAGWPGERAMPDAAAARVYVAVHTLRKQGLAPYLLRHEGGYLLDPALAVVTEEGPLALDRSLSSVPPP